MCDYDGPSVFTETVVRGRKEHRCVECKRVMPKGEEHEMCKGVWDGEWSTYRTCLPCRDLRNRISAIKHKEYGDACYVYGDLAEDVTDWVAWDAADGGASVLCGHPVFTRDKFRPKAWGPDTHVIQKDTANG